MAWRAYRLIYKAMSPIHIGWHTLGYIKLTRPYITGRAIWGAMTANRARSVAKDGVFPEYEEIGDLFKSKVLTGYLYPALDPQKPLLPKYSDEGIKIGHYNLTEFEKIFIRSFGQTGIVPVTNTAEEETLHESEFISPVIMEASSVEAKQVFFIGYLFLNDEAEYNGKKVRWKDLIPALKELYVGGDRKYGWGRLLLDQDLTKEIRKDNFFNHNIDLKNDKLKLTINEGEPIPAHLIAVDTPALKLQGDVEPLIGRKWGSVLSEKGDEHIGFGREVSKAKICWMPGSILSEEVEFTIGEFGLLRYG